MLWKYGAVRIIISTQVACIDRLFKRAFKLDYCKELFLTENIIAMKDKKLWNKITDSNSTTALDDLLPPE